MRGTRIYITKLSSVFTITVGGLVIIGWLFDITLFKSVLPGIVSMKFNVALCFILSGFTLYLLNSPAGNQTRKKIARVCSWIILLTGLLVISEYTFRWDAGIDQFFWKESPGAIATRIPGEMSLGTSFLFSLLGFIFLTIDKRKYHPLILVMLFTMIPGSLLVIFNHLFGTSFLTLIANISSTALHTAVLTIVLCIGLFYSSSIIYFKFSFQHKLIIFFVLVSLILLMIFFAHNYDLKNSENTAKAVSHSQEILLKTEEVNSRANEMQIGVNGYIMTGEDKYQFIFNQAADTVYKIIQNLGRMTKNNYKEQPLVDSIGKIINNYISTGKKLINVGRNEGIDSAHKLLLINDERFMSSWIGRLQLSIENEEYQQLLQLRTDYGKNLQNSSRIIIVSHVFTILLLLLGLFVVVNNNRRRNNLETALQKSLKENPDYKYALDVSSIVGITNEAGIIIFANDNFCKISRYKKEELIGQNHRIINSGFHPKEFFRDLWTTITLGKIWRGEIKNRAKDGSTYWVYTTIVPFLNEKGQPYQYLAIRSDITERKKAEEEKERLLNVLQKSLNEIYLFNPDTLKFEYVNEGARKNLGYSLEEMLAMTPLDIKPEFTQEKFRKLLARAIHSSKEKIIFETVHKRKDKSLYPVEVHLQMITYSGQSVFLAVILDITDRKNAEKELKKSNERFELIASATNDALWDWNLVTNEIWGNEIHQQLYGLTTDDPVPTEEEWKQRIHPGDREQSVKRLKDFLASQARSISEEYQFYTENKGWMNVFGRTLVERNEEGKPVRLVGSMMDITESKKAGEKLMESEEKFRTLVQQAADGIFLVDQDGNYLEANQSAAMITGYSTDELKKMNAAEIISKEDLKQTPLQLEKIKKGSTVFLERIIEKKDGTLIHVDISAKLMDNGKVIVIMRDTTDRKEADEKLKKFAADLQASNTELERFAYIASHDLQEPLRMINSFINLLEEEMEGKLSETSREYFRFIIDGAQRMKTLINDLLLYSRVGGNKQAFTDVDLNQVMEYATRLLGEDIKKSRAILRVSNLPVIAGDKTLIGQLLVNLLGNALKYHSEKEPVIKVGFTEEQEQFVFFVKDNGIGIDAKFFDKIFIIFQRLHNKNEYSGTGIGLAICKKIVEIHKGKIWVESQEGEGSTFYFSIPKK